MVWVGGVMRGGFAAYLPITDDVDRTT